MTGLTNGTAYTFELRAKARATHGDSSVATATPERRVCPTITVGGLSNQSVTLGQSVSLTATGSGSQGSYWYELGAASETRLTIGEMNGKIAGTPTKTGTYRVTVTVRDGNGCSGTGSFTLTVRCPPVRIGSILDVTATKGQAMDARTAKASGGPSSFTYTMSGAPAGVGIKTVTVDGRKVGRISGKPSETGTFRVTVTARNGCGSTGTRQFTITVSCPSINVGGLSNVTATKGQAMSTLTATATGGTAPYTFTMADAPGGVNINVDNTPGKIGGAPTETGTFRVTVTARSACGCEGTGTFKITVNAPTLTISCPPNQTATTCVAITAVSPTAEGGCEPYTYAMTGGPAGITIDESSGEITGASTKTGTFNARVTVTDEEETTASCTFQIKVSCPTINIAAISNVAVNVGNEMPSRTATASGGKSPYTYTISGAPKGVEIDEDTGEISGKPAKTGTFTATVTATSACGCTGTRDFKIEVSCPTIAIEPIADARATVGGAMPTRTAVASGGKTPYSYAISGQPGDVVINSSTGVIDDNVGETPGEYTVNVTATDKFGCEGTLQFEVEVTAVPPPDLADIADVDTDVNKPMRSITPSVSGGNKPFRFTTTGKPAGIMSSTSTGVISGTPTGTGTSTLTVTVTDASDSTDSESFKLYVSRALSVASISDVVVTWQLDMDPIQASASGGRSPYTYSLESPPAGISINSSTGVISGTPSQLGSASVTVIVKDRGKRQVTTSFTMTVARPGDFNGDGRRDAKDSAMFNRKFGLRAADGGYDKRMDLNKGGVINMADLIILTKYIEDDASSTGGSGDTSDSGG